VKPENNASDLEDGDRHKKKYPFNAEPFKKYHEDYEAYDNKKPENKE